MKNFTAALNWHRSIYLHRIKLMILEHLHYPVAIIGTTVTILLAWLVPKLANRIINRREKDARRRYSLRQATSTVVMVLATVIIIVLWARLLQRTGTFLGLIGAGVAVAMREPLLSIAGRIAISAGDMYGAGDRIEVENMRGDVIDVGFFYTRVMEIGNWISGDQYTGRIIQFANAKAFGTPIFNYTRNFAYIWDEIKVPITYSSNVRMMTEFLLDSGEEYSKVFLEGAHQQIEEMRRAFLISQFELRPQVYTEITDNYIVLTMRYLVDPKKRRAARTYLFHQIFDRVRQRSDIAIGSTTMDVSVQEDSKKSPAGTDPEQAA